MLMTFSSPVFGEVSVFRDVFVASASARTLLLRAFFFEEPVYHLSNSPLLVVLLRRLAKAERTKEERVFFVRKLLWPDLAGSRVFGVHAAQFCV